MMNKRNTVDRPESLLVEILSKVPTNSLARFRSTSKGWNALIKDERLSKKHSAPRQSLAIMLINFRVYLVSVDLRGTQENYDVAPSRKLTRQFSLKDPLSDHAEEVDICNVFHCDGLLLCITKDDRFVVCNPVTGKTKWIQPRNSYKKYDLFALGYDSKSSCYKIIRMDRFVGGSDDGVIQTDYDIYDFTSNSWSVVGVTTDWYVPWNRSRGLSVKGNTYWLARTRHRLSNTLLSFDFSTGRFQTHSLPQSLPSYSADAALSVVRDDQLCLLGLNPLEVWMASKNESTGVMSWSKFLTAKTSYGFSHWISFLADEQNKVLVCYDNMINMVPNNIFHIVGQDRHIQVDLHGSTRSSCSFLLSYVPTLAQI